MNKATEYARRAEFNRSFANNQIMNCSHYLEELEHQDIFNRCEMVSLDDLNMPECDILGEQVDAWETTYSNSDSI